jgi:hypothetical protein
LISPASSLITSVVMVAHLGRQTPLVEGVIVPRSPFLDWTWVLELVVKSVVDGPM